MIKHAWWVSIDDHRKEGNTEGGGNLFARAKSGVHRGAWAGDSSHRMVKGHTMIREIIHSLQYLQV